MFQPFTIVTIITIIAITIQYCHGDEVSPMLFDLQATCLGSTGHSAVLEVSWTPIQSLSLPPGVVIPPNIAIAAAATADGDGDGAQQQNNQDNQDGLSSSWYTFEGDTDSGVTVTGGNEVKLMGVLTLIGEFNQLHQQFSRAIPIAHSTTHFTAPAWALQPHAFSSLLLKQAGVVVGRLEFIELGAMCGHNLHFEGDVDGGAHLPEIAIQ